MNRCAMWGMIVALLFVCSVDALPRRAGNSCTANNPCQNGATCRPRPGGRFTCLCEEGFTGRRCETADVGKRDVAGSGYDGGSGYDYWSSYGGWSGYDDWSGDDGWSDYNGWSDDGWSGYYAGSTDDGRSDYYGWSGYDGSSDYEG